MSYANDLLRQAYLLTGDPDRARRLADRAGEAGRVHARRHGRAGADDHAAAELIRSFLADPGPTTPPLPAGPPVHQDVAVWHAVRRLPPRRRAVVVLRYDEGLSTEQAAARLGTSEQLVRADVDAALLTLRTALPGVDSPWKHVAGALGAAGRGRAAQPRPAPARAAEVLAAPRPEPADLAPDRPAGRRRATRATRVPRPNGTNGTNRTNVAVRPVVLAVVAVAGVLLAAAIVVPRLHGTDPATSVSAAASRTSPPSLPRRTVPTASVAEGLLDWPARGQLIDDPAVVGAARAAWKAGVPAGEAPVTASTVLWAGQLDGRTTVVMQALDPVRRPRVAQLTGRSTGTLRLARTEPLRPGTAVLSLLPPKGPSGPVRVLVAPEAQVADGLRAANPLTGRTLAVTAVGEDGISDVLPSPAGVPTTSRVLLLGLDPAGAAASGAHVLFSGQVSADKLGGTPTAVEVGSPTLARAGDAEPATGWFTDGARLAPSVPGSGPLTVASLGPRLLPRQLPDGRSVSSRAYELRRGGARYVGSVVDLGPTPLCTSVLPVAAAGPAPAGWLLRCPVPGGSSGLLHVVGGAGAQSVDVSLQPTTTPAGQVRYEGSAARPANAPIVDAFAVLQVVPSGFPRGTGTLQVHRGDNVSTVPVGTG